MRRKVNTDPKLKKNKNSGGGFHGVAALETV